MKAKISIEWWSIPNKKLPIPERLQGDLLTEGFAQAFEQLAEGNQEGELAYKNDVRSFEGTWKID